MRKFLSTTAVLLLVSGAGFAQEKEKPVVKVLPQKIIDNPKVLDQRTIKHWSDGQIATPTGHQATGIGSGYSALEPPQKAVIVAPKAYNTSRQTVSALDPRKIYHWQDGQRATPQGHYAAGVNDNAIPLNKEKAEADELANTQRSANMPSAANKRLDPRKIYNWPDGTSSTPSGYRATPVNANTRAVVKEEPVPKKKHDRY